MYNSYDHKSPPPSAPAAPPPGAPSYGYQRPQPQPPPYGHYTATGIPIPMTVQPTGPSSWTTGLCDCCSDVPNCCITCWCPCITFGQIADIADRGASSCGVQGALYSVICLLTGCGCIYSCLYRSKVRQQYMLPETPCVDCCVHCCCESCALCQEYRELKNRGFDMSIGWQGNMARQSQGIVMPPVAPGGMTR